MGEQKKTKEKPIDIKMPLIIGGVIAGLLALLFIVSDYIVIDPCASPCDGDRQTFMECPTVCVKRTLHDVIFGK